MPVACLRNLQPTPKDHVSAIRRYRGTWLTLPVLRAGWRRVRSCPDEPLKQCWAQMLCFSVPCSSCLMSGWHRQNKSGLGQPDISYAGGINETQFNQFTEAASSSSYKLHSVQILIFLQLSLDELLLCFFFFFFIISVLFSFRSSSVGLANCCRQCWRKGNVEQPTADKNCRGTRPWSICLIYMPHEVVGNSQHQTEIPPPTSLSTFVCFSCFILQAEEELGSEAAATTGALTQPPCPWQGQCFTIFSPPGKNVVLCGS